jgi:haloalkane dehalogenase
VPTTEIDGLQIHYEDTGGDGPPVWFMHGEPTWSYLWRKVIPPVQEAGFRCIAPDMAGFGKSDKPTDIEWYSYDRHVEVMAGLLEQLDLRDVTMVVHDWGGPVGLRLGVEHPDRISRFVIMNTGLFTGHQKMSDAWIAFRDFVARTEDLPIGMLVSGAVARGMDDETLAAYEGCFPDAASKAGARAFPLMLPTTPDAPGAEAGQRVLDAMRDDERPKLLLWADRDPIIPLEVGRRFAEAIDGPQPIVIENASHFLQEDAGDVIGGHIARWLTASA